MELLAQAAITIDRPTSITPQCAEKLQSLFECALPWMPAHLPQSFLFNNSSNFHVFTAQLETHPADPIGAAVLDLRPAEQENTRAHLELLAVAENYRYCGVGKMLLQSVINDAQGSGYESLRLITSSSAHPFYLRQGFVFAGLNLPAMDKILTKI